MDNKLHAKDLINIGIFTAILYVVFFITAMLGYIPILFILLPFIMPITSAIPFMLFLTRVKKFGMITIMTFILGLVMYATGHTWIPLLTAIICGLLADCILKAGGYRKFRYTILGYAVFSLWPLGNMLPLWIMRDSYFAYIRNSMGEEYTNAILTLTPGWILVPMIAAGFAAAIAGAYFGRSVLAKHFRRAGIA